MMHKKNKDKIQISHYQGPSRVQNIGKAFTRKITIGRPKNKNLL